MPEPTIPTLLDALVLALREAIAPALAAGVAFDAGIATGPRCEAYGAGHTAGRADLARDVAALLDAAMPPAGGEESGHG